MARERWECTVKDTVTGAVFITVEEVSPPMAQASAEVAAIKRHPERVREHLRCLCSCFLCEVPS